MEWTLAETARPVDLINRIQTVLCGICYVQVKAHFTGPVKENNRTFQHVIPILQSST